MPASSSLRRAMGPCLDWYEEPDQWGWRVRAVRASQTECADALISPLRPPRPLRPGQVPGGQGGCWRCLRATEADVSSKPRNSWPMAIKLEGVGLCGTDARQSVSASRLPIPEMTLPLEGGMGRTE